MDSDTTRQAYTLVREALGDWWQDDRRRWCAYCGIPMRLKVGKGRKIPPTKLTRDHVIPRKHNGGLLTIPACRACNAAKGSLSLQEFLLTDYFRERRKHRHGNQWSIDELWLVTAVAALKISAELMKAAPTKPDPGARPLARKSAASGARR